MEREGAEETVRLMRAIRSLAYNRELQPLVNERIERAEAKIRGHLANNDLTSTRVGYYQVELDEAGDISLSRLPGDDWQQMALPQVVDEQWTAGRSGDYWDEGRIEGVERLSVSEESSLAVAGR